MITIITGTPGSGKTLKAVEMILALQKEGRRVYADINGLNIQGVELSPDDWRDTPEGSVVVYDEAQDKELLLGQPVKIFASTGQTGPSHYEIVRAMEKHRHTGHDLIFITQDPTFLHSHIRKLTGKHFHVFRAMGLKAATVYGWDRAVSNPNDYHEQKKADVQRWSYPSDLFKHYKSATVHTHKFRLPKKLLYLSLAAAAFIGIAFYMAQNSAIATGILASDKEEAQNPAKANGVAGGGASSSDYSNPVLTAIHTASPSTVSVMGCVSGQFCRCFGEDGYILDISETMCRDLAQGNLALPIKIANAASGSQRPTE